MNVEITGRQIAVTPALREFTREKLRKLERLLDEPIDAHVVLDVVKHRHTAEIQIKSGRVKLSGTEVSEDLYASIHEVVEKLERQARKHKTKTQSHKHRRSPRAAEVAARISDSESQASVEAEERDADVGPLVVRSRSYRVKPMSPEDALIELEDSGLELLVYRDAESYRMNVLYRQADGNYGLIDPEF